MANERPQPADPRQERPSGASPATPLATRLGLGMSVWFMSLFAAAITAALIGVSALFLLKAYYGTNREGSEAAMTIAFGVACAAGGRLLLAMCATHVRRESRGAIDAAPMVVGCALGYGAVLVLLSAWPALLKLRWFVLLLPMGTTVAASYATWRGTGLHVACAVAAVGALVTLYVGLAG